MPLKRGHKSNSSWKNKIKQPILLSNCLTDAGAQTMYRLDKVRLVLLLLAASSLILSSVFFFSAKSPEQLRRKSNSPSQTGFVRLKASDRSAGRNTSSGSKSDVSFSGKGLSSDVASKIDISPRGQGPSSDVGLDPSQPGRGSVSNQVDVENQEADSKTRLPQVAPIFFTRVPPLGVSSTAPVLDNTTLTTSDGINWCPDNPPFLEGPLASMQQDVTAKEMITWYPSLEPGGRLRPPGCVPRQRLAIVIPYRNRYSHLHIMLNNLIPVLQRQQADVTFFVIEQAPPQMFNRGALLNIGFLEALKVADFDCFIFHDVDMIPLNDHNLYRCGENPRHFAVSLNKFGYKLLYKGYFGGVVGFTRKQYETVNGCSNIYFGWGGEDDDLLARLRNKDYAMTRYDVITTRYDMLSHNRDRGNEENPLRGVLLRDALRRQDREGLNTTKYTVNSIHKERLYTWINVSLNVTQVLQTAPDSTLRLMQWTVMQSKVKDKTKKDTIKTKRTDSKSSKKWKAHLSLTISLVTPKDFPSFSP